MNTGKSFTENVKFGPGRCASSAESQRRKVHGYDLRWRGRWINDPDRRVELYEKLRDKLKARQAAREGSAPLSGRELRAMQRCADERPALYRHYLLRNLQNGAELIAPLDEWATKFIEEAILSAKKLFHDVAKQDDGCTVRVAGKRTSESSADDASSGLPEFKLLRNSTRLWIKNSTRTKPSRPGAKFKDDDLERNIEVVEKLEGNICSLNRVLNGSSTPERRTTSRTCRSSPRKRSRSSFLYRLWCSLQPMAWSL